MTEPNTGFRYKAFISYSWKDKDAAGALHRALEAFRTPKALLERAAANGAIPERLAPIFRDRDEEAAGASLKAAIEDGLDNSEFLIIVCSPDAAASPWVNKEIAYFRKKRTPGNILTYVIGGEPGPHCFAPALRFESTVDGVIGDEPIEQPLAADAREEGDGKRLARLKIAAAMLGVGLDDLVRRDAQRRARRLRYALAGVSAVALGFAGIAAIAVFQWDKAVKNEQRATREAMKASRTAEFMVKLFEVPDPSESRGREVTAREILDKGVKTIETGLADEPDVQATLMYTMGRTYTGLGLYPDAVRILSVARDKRIAIEADPADVFAAENALARAEFEKGDLEAAKKLYSSLVAKVEADIAAGKWRVDYATALIGMGETTLYADTPEEAQTYYERARDLLASRGMGESEEMARVLQGMGVIATSLGQYAQGIQNLRKSESIFQKKFGQADYLVAAAKNDIATAYYFQRNFAESEREYRKVLEIELVIFGEKHPETLITKNNLARMQMERGDLTGARDQFQSIVLNYRDAGRENDFYFVYPLNSLGELNVELGDYAAGVSQLAEALAKAQRTDRMFGPITINFGRAQCEIGNDKSGLESILAGRLFLNVHYDTTDWRFGVADEFESRCRRDLGQIELATRLAKSGHERLQEELGSNHFFTQRAKKWLEDLEK